MGECDGDGRKEFLVIFFERTDFLVLGLLLFRDGFADFAGILTAERHADRFREGNHLRVVVQHLDPRHALEDIPLAAAGKDKGGQNNDVGEPPHT